MAYLGEGDVIQRNGMSFWIPVFKVSWIQMGIVDGVKELRSRVIGRRGWVRIGLRGQRCVVLRCCGVVCVLPHEMPESKVVVFGSV